MANWYGTCRSNYFRIKDEEAFLAMMNQFEVDIIRKDDKVGFVSQTEFGDIPQYWPGDDFQEEPICILNCLAEHLAENSVCVVMEIGAEKARYLTGQAIAIAWTGEVTTVSINDIYKQAQEEFGGDAEITEVMY
jgi:hypothetical protein